MAHASRWPSSIQMETLSIKRGKRNGVVDKVVDPAMFRGSHRGLGLAKGHRGLYRAQPVTVRGCGTKVRCCSTCRKPSHNARTCQEGAEATNAAISDVIIVIS